MEGVTFVEPETPAKRKPSGWRKQADATWKARARTIGRKPRVMSEPVPVPCPRCYAPMVVGESGYRCEGKFCNGD
jgi:hypothetical protein